MEYLGTIYKGSQSDIIFPVPFIELSDGATVDFYTDGDGGFSRTKDEIKIDNYMLRTTASADELNSLSDGVLNYTINTCMGKSEGDTGLYLSEPSSYVDKQYLTADNVKTINGESIVGQGNIEIQGGGSEDYVWEWSDLTQTGETTYTDDEINKAISAFENGQRIIIAYKDLYIYPNFTNAYKGYLEIEYSYKGLNYRFRYNGSNLQFNNIINDGYTYVWAWWRGSVPSLNNISTRFSINDVKSVMAAYDSGKKIEITYVGKIKMPVYAISRNTNQIALYFASDYIYNYSWYCVLSDDGSSITNQHLNKFETQEQLTPLSYPYVKNIDLSTNRNVDSILTTLKSSAETTNSNINTLSGSVVNNYYTKTEVDDKIKNTSGGTSDSETYIWEWGNLYTGDTTFTNEQITEIEKAYNDGKNIILELNGGKIYPNSFSLSKDGNDVFITMYFLENGNNCYKWEYFNYVSNDLSGQTLEVSKFMAEGNNVNIKCKSITTQGHGNLDTAITNLEKQIQSGSSENLQKQIDDLNQSITVEGEARKKVDDELQQQINGVNESIPRKTSQLTNDSGYLTSVPAEYAKTADIEKIYLSKNEATKFYLRKTDAADTYQSKGYSYSKSESDTNYASKADTYTKEEIDTKIGDINNILESI